MGLTTLPMPKDDTSYDWTGTRLGNSKTCEAQAFCFVFGIVCMFGYNAMLCVYYACIIGLKMKEKVIKKYVEPIFHIAPILVGLLWSVPHLFSHSYQPSGWDAWCSVRGKNADLRASIRTTILFTLIVLSTLVLSSFILIIWRVVHTERLLNPLIYKNGRKRKLQRRSNFLNQTKEAHKNTKVILTQAFAYILVFLITLIAPLLRSLISHEGAWIIHLQIVLMPLQGFFNILIFIYHKVYNYRRIHHDVSICSVLHLLFKGSLEERLFFSRISLLQYDEHMKEVEIEIIDEENVERAILFTGEDGDLSLSLDDDNKSGMIDPEGRSTENGHENGHANAQPPSITSRGGLSGFSSTLLKPMSNTSSGSNYDRNHDDNTSSLFHDNDESRKEITNNNHSQKTLTSRLRPSNEQSTPHPSPSSLVRDDFNDSDGGDLSFASPSRSTQVSFHGIISNDADVDADVDRDGADHFNINQNESVSKGWWFSRISNEEDKE